MVAIFSTNIAECNLKEYHINWKFRMHVRLKWWMYNCATHLGKHCDSYHWKIIATGTLAIHSHDMAVDALNVFLGLETEDTQVIFHEVNSIVKKLLEF